MPGESPSSRPSEEQPIKSRKAELFDAPAPEGSTGPRKPFSAYLKETPAAPLSTGVKAMLWAAAAVVVLLFLGALLRGHNRPPAGAPSTAPDTAPGAARPG